MLILTKYMISREQVESLLKINGISNTSPDEHIRSVLLSARYNHDEIDTALMVLREDLSTKQTRVDGLHKIFRSDNSLDPKEISKLLGIEVDARQFLKQEEKYKGYAVLNYTLIWILSVALAVIGIMSFMYLNQVGIFYVSTTNQQTVQQIGSL